MASYPTFAFFASPPSLKAIRLRLADALGDRLPLQRSENAAGEVVDDGGEPASFSLANPHTTVEVARLRDSGVWVGLSDFPAEFYDEKRSPARAWVEEKRRLALDIHRVLQGHGAQLVYSSRFDDHGSDDPFALAERIGRAPDRGADFVRENPGYFWLYTGRSDASPAEGFEPADEGSPRVFENRAARPLFMNL